MQFDFLVPQQYSILRYKMVRPAEWSSMCLCFSLSAHRSLVCVSGGSFDVSLDLANVEQPMMPTLQLLLAIFLVLWIYILWSRRKYYKLIAKIRGPLGYPIVGMAHRLRKREEILQTFHEHERKFGYTFFSWLGPYPFLVVSDPQIAQDIFTSAHCANKGFIYNALDDGTGRGLFSLRNPEWSVHRKLLNPAFGHKVLLNFIPIFNKEVNALMKTLDLLPEQSEVDLMRIIQQFTLSIATETTMGQNLCDRSSSIDNKRLLNCYQRLLENMTDMCFSPWLSFRAVHVLLGDYSAYKQAKDDIRRFIRNLVAEKIEKATHDPANDFKLDQNIFINRAIDLMKRKKFTWQNVVDESNVIVFGAFETTANTITYTLMLLAMFPQYQEKAFDEIRALFPERGCFEVSYADTQDMVYMDMVLNEAMRVMAPVPIVARQTEHDTQLSNGILLPKGVQIAIDIFNMHRREDIWGADARIFNPDNFLPSNLEGKHTYAFIPFTKGIRNCIGWKYALMSIKVSLAKLLRNYRFTTSFKYDDLHFVEDITIKLKTTPLFQIHKRYC